MPHPLVHLNAALNTLATVLLIVGLLRIKRGAETAHGKTMLAAFVVSSLFLASYLTYHYIVRGNVKFTHPGAVRYIYYGILISHILLAITVPVFAVGAIWYGSLALGWGRRGAALDAQTRVVYRRKHLRLVRWAFPIWLYVSVTGVLVYLMLYHLWPPTAA